MAPVAMDLYLPAFPQMMQDLNTTALGVQLSVTAFLVGGGAGQLVFGPLSDRWGRRPPLLLGSGVAFAACLLAAAAPSVEVLVLARLLAGLSAAAGMVLSRAVVTDVARGRAAAKALSVMMLIGGIAPVIAPPFGGLLAGSLGWRGLLMIVAALAGVMFVAVLVWVPESHPAERRARHRELRSTGQGSRLLTRAYLGNMLAFGFAMAGFMAYITASSVVFQLAWGVSTATYGVIFGIGALVLMGGSAVSAAHAERFATERLLAFGLALMLAGGAVFAVLVGLGLNSVWAAAPLFCAFFGLGFVLGNAAGLALAAVPHATGRASAWLGASQYGLGALSSALVGLGGESSAVPLAVVFLVAVILAFVCQRVAGARP
jgi:MFS transporter, DHA1 family, multidrug resistance protein